MIEHVLPAPARAAQIRRAVTTVARTSARHSDAVFFTATVLILTGAAFDTGPTWVTTASVAMLVVYGIAAFGLNRAFDLVAETVADILDPDLKDGATAHDIADLLGELSADIGNGANTDDILANLHTSSLVSRLRITLVNLAVTYAEEGDHMKSQRLYRAAGHLNFVDREVSRHQA